MRVVALFNRKSSGKNSLWCFQMAQQNRKSKNSSQEYEYRKREVGLLLDARSKQAMRKISLQFGGRKQKIRGRRRRITVLAVLATLLGGLGILHEFFF
jgi:hypothetical protein